MKGGSLKDKERNLDSRKLGERMSFDVNVLSTKPVIKAAASMQNDGGGGNLGYMAQGRKKKEEKKYLDENIFMKKQSEDIFTFDKEPEMPKEKFSLAKLISDILNTVKKIFMI